MTHNQLAFRLREPMPICILSSSKAQFIFFLIKKYANRNLTFSFNIPMDYPSCTPWMCPSYPTEGAFTLEGGAALGPFHFVAEECEAWTGTVDRSRAGLGETELPKTAPSSSATVILCRSYDLCASVSIVKWRAHHMGLM